MSLSFSKISISKALPMNSSSMMKSNAGISFRILAFLVTLSIALEVVTGQTYIRVNSLSFGTLDSKNAVVLSSSALGAVETYWSVMDSNGKTFYLTDFSAATTVSQKWSSTFAFTYQLDFSFLTTPGIYTIGLHQLTSVNKVLSFPIISQSPPFNITTDMADVYNTLLSNSLFFFRAQRDGADVDPTVMNRKPSHLMDKSATIYQTPSIKDDALKGSLTPLSPTTVIDISGGWHDAGDYLKFVQTASYCLDLMLLAYRDYGSSISSSSQLEAEILHGLGWLIKTWNPTKGTLYYQVGLGDGNSNIMGDHDVDFRLPEADDLLNVQAGSADYYVKFRPVFQTGSTSPNSLSPNLAGRVSAAFALCYQVFRTSNASLANTCLSYAESVYSFAQTSPPPSELVTAAPFDFYPETEWADDMALGAIQLYLATSNIVYLQNAATFVADYMSDDSPDTINLYDVSGVAQYEIYKVIQKNPPTVSLAVSLTTLLNSMKSQVQTGLTVKAKDPFHFGEPYNSGNDLVPRAFGYWLQASFYDEIANNNNANSQFQIQQRDWIFGNNAWGSSFVVGSTSVFPFCMQHQISNLIGPQSGSGANILLGATVDGPSVTDNFDDLGGTPGGAKNCPSNNGDTFLSYSGEGVRYQDNVASWPSVEPADDYTVTGLYVFARLAAQYANQIS